jgi:hypothetical protein
VGFYIVPFAFLALLAQIWVGGRTDDAALYVLIAVALMLSATPFLLTFPASWRGEVSATMIDKVPWAAAIASGMIVFLAAAIFELDVAGLRVGAIAAGAGITNALSIRLLGGRGSLAKPSRWTKMSLVTGACIGFCIGFVSIAPVALVGNGANFGIYVAASHWLVRSVIDNSAGYEDDAPISTVST